MDLRVPAAPATPALPPLGAAARSIVELTAADLSHAIHARDVSCVDVLNAYWAQIDRLNPLVNALVAPVDREWMLGRARDLDAELARGESRGPMHGFPQAP